MLSEYFIMSSLQDQLTIACTGYYALTIVFKTTSCRDKNCIVVIQEKNLSGLALVVCGYVSIGIVKYLLQF